MVQAANEAVYKAGGEDGDDVTGGDILAASFSFCAAVIRAVLSNCNDAQLQVARVAVAKSVQSLNDGIVMFVPKSKRVM